MKGEVVLEDISLEEVNIIIKNKLKELDKNKEINLTKDELMIILPLTENQGVIVSVFFDEANTKKVQIKIMDTVYILPKINKNFEFYERISESEEKK